MAILNHFMAEREKMNNKILTDPHVQDSTKPTALIKMINTKVGR